MSVGSILLLISLGIISNNFVPLSQATSSIFDASHDSKCDATYAYANASFTATEWFSTANVTNATNAANAANARNPRNARNATNPRNARITANATATSFQWANTSNGNKSISWPTNRFIPWSSIGFSPWCTNTSIHWTTYETIPGPMTSNQNKISSWETVMSNISSIWVSFKNNDIPNAIT